MFLSISKDASNLRKNTFNNPHGISFSPASDILDVKSILNEVLQKNVVKQKEVYAFIKDELGNEVDVVKLDSNLAMISAWAHPFARLLYILAYVFNIPPARGLCWAAGLLSTIILYKEGISQIL